MMLKKGWGTVLLFVLVCVAGSMVAPTLIAKADLTETYTHLGFENMVIRYDVEAGEFKLYMNSTQIGAGLRKGRNDPVPLTAGQQTTLSNFIIPRYQALATSLVLTPDGWAAP